MIPAGERCREYHRGGDGECLHAELRRIAGEKSVRAGRIHRLRREHARQQRAEDAGNAVTGEDVERVVDARVRTHLHRDVARTPRP